MLTVSDSLEFTGLYHYGAECDVWRGYLLTLIKPLKCLKYFKNEGRKEKKTQKKQKNK